MEVQCEKDHDSEVVLIDHEFSTSVTDEVQCDKDTYKILKTMLW